ncbi:MAG: hypothetical protein F6K19_02245 [Cyanothece sp. SIO1E1]|nr:hypothetical protein [Cyanothece sp. SIO1E1]
MFTGLDKLQGPPLWDENSFWQTSLLFSHSLIPDPAQLKNYKELTTPLTFIIFGALEYIFQHGIFVGRLLNFSLSFLIIALIGWPIQKRKWHSILAACGLLLCPYYLFASGYLYTDMIACFLAFLGFWFYMHNRHVLSGAAFILGIASRQYILAFPMAIAAFELMAAWRASELKVRTQIPIRWLAPVIASLSIAAWILLFQGLAPSAAIASKTSLESQLTWWVLEPENGLYFLTVVGLYFVIPEFILFHRQFKVSTLLNRKTFVLALGLLFLFFIFPLSSSPHGLLPKIVQFLPYDSLKIVLFYGLALLTCLRFSRINLTLWILLMNFLVMMKAYPWDKYVLPLLVVYWYLKAIDCFDQDAIASPALCEVDNLIDCSQNSIQPH